jgi:hypothetical protein
MEEDSAEFGHLRKSTVKGYTENYMRKVLRNDLRFRDKTFPEGSYMFEMLLKILKDQHHLPTDIDKRPKLNNESVLGIAN